MEKVEYKFDTQLLIEGHDLDEDVINEHIRNSIEGDSLLAVGDDELIKIHYHTNTPWKVLEYCASCGGKYGASGQRTSRLRYEIKRNSI